MNLDLMLKFMILVIACYWEIDRDPITRSRRNLLNFLIVDLFNYSYFLTAAPLNFKLMKKFNSLQILNSGKLIVGRRIFLSIMILMVSNLVFSQKVIKGSVKSESGQPLADVSVVVSGTSGGTVSDVNGNYSLSVDNNAKSLTFSLVGMKSVIEPI